MAIGAAYTLDTPAAHNVVGSYPDGADPTVWYIAFDGPPTGETKAICAG